MMYRRDLVQGVLSKRAGRSLRLRVGVGALGGLGHRSSVHAACTARASWSAEDTVRVAGAGAAGLLSSVWIGVRVVGHFSEGLGIYARRCRG